MVFSSTVFLFGFLPVFLIAYYVSRGLVRNTILVVFSLFFYIWGEPKYFWIILILSFIIYIFGILIENNEKQFYRKLLLIFGIILISSFLVYFKYIGFFVQNINSLFHSAIQLPDLPLPLGISFFTFQALSYIVDVYKKKIHIEKNPFYVLLYLTLFPKLTMGPIVRYTTIRDEIKCRNISIDDIVYGTERFIIGLAKKIIIANQLGLLADGLYSGTNYSTPTIWLAAIAYMLQIYFDFSSYSDMAIGIGRMIGFHFLENFNYPYTADSVTEFWKRWHISLSSWFRDYIYIPLGGNRCNIGRQIFNMFVVWAFTGLWHGASWNFILWGIYYLIFLIVEKYILKDILSGFPRFLKHIYLLLIVMFGWVLFRAENLNECITFAKYLLIPAFDDISMLNAKLSIIKFWPYLVLAFIFSMPIYDRCKAFMHHRIKNESLRKCIKYICLLTLFFVTIIYLVNSTFNAFIYTNF